MSTPLGRILDKNRADLARDDPTLNDVRDCLDRILLDATEQAQTGRGAEAYAFLKEHHARKKVRDLITDAVRNRGTSGLFEAALVELEQKAGVPVHVANTATFVTLFIFGRDAAPRQNGPQALLEHRPEPAPRLLPSLRPET